MFDQLLLLTAFSATAFVVVVHAGECTPYDKVEVKIDGGRVLGTIRKADGGARYYSFSGMRYTKSRTGRQRFLAPEPVNPWHNVYDATEECRTCPQKDLDYNRLLLNTKGQSEDCLCVNVHVPITAEISTCADNSEKTRLMPIVVMVNEGGFQSGSGNSDFHGPEFLMRHNLMVVTANTRHGVFGYLSLGIPEVPGNNGLRDWIAVLRWLQDNARAFGGDPNNITLLGSSTGAAIAHLIAVSPVATGLFNKLMLSSGLAMDTFYSLSPTHAERMADQLRKSISGSSSDPHEFYEQLINMDLRKIMSGFAEVQVNNLVSFGPVIERPYEGVEQIISQYGTDSILEGKDCGYPVLILEHDNEMQFVKSLPVIQMMPSMLKSDPTVIIADGIKYNLTSEETQEIADNILSNCLKSPYDLDDILDIMTKQCFLYPNRKYAQLKSKLPGAPMYMGSFRYEADYSVIKEGVYLDAPGAVHCEALTYVFKSYLLGDRDTYPPKNRDDKMRDMMTTIVANFAKCGNPTCTDDIDSEWPPVQQDNISYVVIDEPYKYKLTCFTEEDLDMIKKFDSVDIRLRDAVDQVNSD